MIRVLIPFVAAFLCLSTWAGTVSSEPVERDISIYVPPFEGPAGLSQSVNTILRVQIWQTLRKSAGNGAAAASFGQGVVRWGPTYLTTLTHTAAETVALHGRITSQLVLWGTVQEYGGGAIVQANLSIPKYKRMFGRYYEDFLTERKEEWTVAIPLAESTVEFRQDVPRRRLSFEPIILTKDVIDNYSDLNALVMYDPESPDKKIGTVGDIIDAVKQYGDKALVTSRRITGLVYLPELSRHRSEVVDFASGLIRIFRGDWKGARALLKRVSENSRAPTDIRIDACLYQAMANAQLGLSGEKDIQRARKLNPYAVRTVRFAIMENLAQLRRAIEKSVPSKERRQKIAAIRDLVANHRHLFLAQDPWLEHLSEGLDRLTGVQ